MRNTERIPEVNYDIVPPHGRIVTGFGDDIDKVFKFTTRNTMLIINVEYPYGVDLSRIETYADLLEWTRHLCDKTWMTTEHIAAFIALVCKAKRWDLPYGS